MNSLKKDGIFIINQFEVPKVSEEAFMDFFSTHIKLIASQAGNMEVRLFKSKEDDNYMVYISIVGWEDEESFKNAGVAIEAISREKGINIREFQEKHKINVINRIFSELPVL